MFYHLFNPLAETKVLGYLIFNVFQYVTFRSIGAFITAIMFSILLGPKFIRILKKYQAVEIIDESLPIKHTEKKGTPTMGGLIIISSLLLSVLLWNNLVNSYVLIMIITTIWLAGIGFLDDYMKNFLHAKQGLIAKYKLLSQVTLGILVASALFFGSEDKGSIAHISLPFLKNTSIYLGIFFIPFGVFMVTATSNAVNLTDGLDGLASGTVAMAAFAIGIMAYIKGNYNIATYMNLEFLPNAGELTVFVSALIGTLMGFMWYNVKPAQIIMGDTGSLSLGGILAVLSMLLREELFFAIVGGIFVMEALSTIIQRYYFKYTRIKFGQGRRVFRCAPFHHHYEMKGIPENKIVFRFWIVAALLAAIGLATLKLR